MPWIWLIRRALLGTVCYALALLCCVVGGWIVGWLLSRPYFERLEAELSQEGLHMCGLAVLPVVGLSVLGGFLVFAILCALWAKSFEDWLFARNADGMKSLPEPLDPDPMGIIKAYEAKYGPLTTQRSEELEA